MRKVYIRNTLVMRPQTQAAEFNKDVGDAIKKLQDEGNEVEIQTQNVKDHFAVLLLGYQMHLNFTDY